jgi:hypothetical protein
VLDQAMHVDVRVAAASLSPATTGGGQQVVTITVEILLRQNHFCNYEDAYAAFAELLEWSAVSVPKWWNRVAAGGLSTDSALKHVLGAVSVTSTPFGSVGVVKTAATACTAQPTSSPTAAAGADTAGTNSGGESAGQSARSSSAIDYLPLYAAGLIAFAVLSVVYVFYSNRNKALLRLDDSGDHRNHPSDGSNGGPLRHQQQQRYADSRRGGAISVMAEPEDLNQERSEGQDVQSAEFYDYDYGSDQMAPTAAFDLIGEDASAIAEVTAAPTFFTRPNMAPLPAAPAQRSASRVTQAAASETDSSTGSQKASGGGLKRGGSFKGGKAKAGTAKGALNLGSLGNQRAGSKTPTGSAASQAAANNRSWSEAYKDEMWHDGEE